VILEVLVVRHEPALMRFFGVLLFLLGIHGSPVAWAGKISFSFKNAELKTVIEKASELTGLAFLYDPKQVKGKISLHLPQEVSPEETLELLSSALSLHGYTLCFEGRTPSGLFPRPRPITWKWCP
jgi:type II secretory pathway component GspD/PulD (secretin)